MQVPPELKDDLIMIADKIEPYLQQVKDQADKIPEKAHELAAKIQPAAEQLGDKIEQGAHKVCILAHIILTCFRQATLKIGNSTVAVFCATRSPHHVHSWPCQAVGRLQVLCMQFCVWLVGSPQVYACGRKQSPSAGRINTPSEDASVRHATCFTHAEVGYAGSRGGSASG